MAQVITVINQPVVGSANNFITPSVAVPDGFTSATYSYSISNPANNASRFNALAQTSSDGGNTWHDMFGISAADGTTNVGSGRLSNISQLVRAIASWNNSFTISISITLLP